MKAKIVSLFFTLGFLLSPIDGFWAAPNESGLPIPRFVSMRAQQANLRVGPGVQYPTEWILTRKTMPLEITAEFDHWRRVRDWQGSEGWVHKSMLSGKRTIVTRKGQLDLRRSPTQQSKSLAIVEENVIGEVLRCEETWCRVQIESHKGWLPRDVLWGISPNELMK